MALGKLGEMGIVDLQLMKDVNRIRKFIAQIIGRMANDRPSTPRIRNGRSHQGHDEHQAHNDRPDNM